MAIAKQLVETMKGEIDFTSKLGEGSTFWFEIEFEHQETLSEEKNSLVHFSGTRVLIINPITNKHQSINDHLSLWPISYDYADHVYQAIDMIVSANNSNTPYNVIFVYQQHLDSDPIKFIHQIKNQSTYKNHRLILVTDGQLPLVNNSQLLRSGYSSIISSNLDRSTLFRVLHAAVAGINTTTSSHKMEISDDASTYETATKELNILVGEDNETNQKVIKSILEYGKHHVTLANNGEEVLDLLEKDTFDLIILDMQMPVMGGIEAAKIFRFMYPNRINIPILMLTANVTTEAINACKEAKFDAYLTKPVEPEKLLNTISSLVDVEATKTNTSTSENNKLKIIDINNPENIPLIDMSSLNSLYSMAKEYLFMKDLIDGYIRDANTNIEKLTISAKHGEFQNMLDLTHALDGSSRSIGAKRLSIITDKFYKLMQTQKQIMSEENVKELKVIFENTCVALNSYLKEQLSDSSKLNS